MSVGLNRSPAAGGVEHALLYLKGIVFLEEGIVEAGGKENGYENRAWPVGEGL